ncbi:lysophosphatidylserine lipase ABHD12-like [Penaeus japonicus]|uniref:lysophosphatidylserine lipase ABHD12-like n=1 Tax=Penaeus japonicus TaxID=27405 RepID=UPI001C7145D7|nr:lysophosphatidylserine lipase ABHD12-like [Penaeus japonicus]
MPRLRFLAMGTGRRGRFKRLLKIVVAVVTFCLFLFCVAFPILVHYSPALQRYLVFRHTSLAGFLFFSMAEDLSKPEDYNLKGTRNFYLQSEDDVSVGVWHILPESLMFLAPDVESEERIKWFENSLTKGKPIFLYLHGNRLSRSAYYRVELYRLLRSMDFHVVTLDYRGFGDSTKVDPTEEGVLSDVKAVFTYLKAKAGQTPILVYGHSLGTGIACHAVADLCQVGSCPKGLLLQSPFNNLFSEIKVHSFGKMLAFLPYYDWSILKPLRESGIMFENEKHIGNIPIPVWILHAQDDGVVPISLGMELYSAAMRSRPKMAAEVRFFDFEEQHGYGHNYIHKSGNLPMIIREFVKISKYAK